MTLPRTELPALLLTDAPGLDTLKNRALHQLAETANTLTELMTLVRNLKGIRQPEPYGTHYSLDDWYRLIQRGDYTAARLFILSHHA